MHKRDAYKKAFHNFDIDLCAEMSDEELNGLLNNEGIIRNRRKIEAAVLNARAFLEVQKEFGSFDRYIWSFTNGEVIDHHLTKLEDMPATSELSEKVSKDLKKRGFRFVGPTIIYSYMQGIGIYNDHLVGCDYR